eukprot:s2664_g7.t1
MSIKIHSPPLTSISIFADTPILLSQTDLCHPCAELQVENVRLILPQASLFFAVTPTGVIYMSPSLVQV